jgi:hypothetical protein
LEFLSRGPLDLAGLEVPGDAGRDALALLDATDDVLGPVEDFDVNFLSDFFMVEDQATLPAPESPPPSSIASSPNSLRSASSPELTASEAMIVGAVPALEFAFDAARLAHKSGSWSPTGSSASSSSSDHHADHHAIADEAAEPKEDESPEERKARRRAQVAISARRHRSRKKVSFAQLRS